MLLLVFLNLFAFLLLVILIARFNTRKEADSNSLIDASTNAPTIGDNNISTELFALCDEEGVTVEDGIILTANQVLEKGDYVCSPSKTYLLGMVEDLKSRPVARACCAAALNCHYRVMVQAPLVAYI